LQALDQSVIGLEWWRGGIARRGRSLISTIALLFVHSVRRNNFPPLPSGCPVQPCFYQDISVDIPLEFQKVVRTIYYLWLG